MAAMRLLVLGDTHIPRRATRIPEEFEELFRELDYHAVVCTGDLTERSVLNYLQKLGRVYAVRGNMDSLPLPETQLIEAEVKIGVVHGDQVYPRGDRQQLQEIAVEMGVKILISGHTHSPDIFKGKVILLNPGSATGVWGGGGGANFPSFMLLNVSSKTVRGKLFKLLGKGVLEEAFELPIH